jgi:hypothetical protein
MQQYPRRKEPAMFRSQRTQPALPGATMPTTPAPGMQGYVRTFYATGKPGNVLYILLLICIGLLLEILFLALLLALANPPRIADAMQKAVPGLLPLLITFYHQAAIHTFSSLLASCVWLNPANSAGRANIVLVVLVLAIILVLGAAHLSKHVAQRKSGSHPRVENPALFWVVLLPTIAFSATMVCAPAVGNSMSQEMLSYGLYGRMIVLYHVNPYVAVPTLFAHDILNIVIRGVPLPGGTPVISPAEIAGPVWLDVCLLVALFAQDTVAHIVYGFRVIGLVAHILNSVLLWMILTKWKPEIRISTVLLYAWNPIVLLLGVAQMHLQIVVTLFILLATFFFMRSSTLLGWIFVVLSVLTCPFYLLLVPLFLRLIGGKTYLTPGRRLLWWIIVCLITILVVVLAYAPYWQDWGVVGLAAQMRALFIRNYAVNSLDGTFLDIPLRGSISLWWIVAPPNWSLLVLGIAGVFLLFGFWIADTPQLVMLCGSWVLLIMVMLQPVYWPWYIIVPFVLAICAINRSTMLLATLLVIGASVAYYCGIGQSEWSRQALLTIGIPLMIGGWVLFFGATWRMTRAKIPEEKRTRPRIKGLSRPAWLSRASWPSRPPSRR